MKLRVATAMLTLLLLAGLLPPATAQEQIDPAKVAEFWRRFSDARNLNDQRSMQRVLRNSKAEARHQYTVSLNGWAKSGDATLLGDLESLATTWELAFADATLRKQVAAFKELKDSERERLGQARADYDSCVYLFNRSQTSKKPEDAQEAITKLTATGETCAEFSDFEYAGHSYSMLARTYQLIASQVSGEQKKHANDGALDAFKKTKEYYSESGWQNDLPWVEAQIKALTEEPGKPAGKVGAEGVPGAAGDDAGNPKGEATGGWTTIGLSYVGRDPSTRWQCPDYADGEVYFLWPQLILRDTEEFKKQVPFGGATLIRDGSQYHVDDESDGRIDRKVKIDNQPHQVDFVLGKGDDSVKYTATMKYGSQSENHFGIGDMNFQPTDLFTQLFYRRHCYMEGEFLGEPFVLIDENSNGEYSMPLRGWNDPKNGEEAFYADAVVIGKKSKRAVPLGEFFVHDEKVYQIKVALYGSSVQVKEVPGAKFGTAALEVVKLRAKPHYLVIRNLDTYKGAMFDISQDRKGTEVPTGKYEIAYGVIQAGKGNRIEKIQILRGKSKPFEIREGEETKIPVGGPFIFDDFDFSGAAGRFFLEAKTIKVYGVSGELYTLFYDDPPVPTITVRSGKRVVIKGEELKRPILSDYQQNPITLWTGLDLQTEVAGQGPFQARLMARHKLLGAILSDWKDPN